MALLDNYFSHLQNRTGAENFVLIRDDAQVASPGSTTMKRRRTLRSSSYNSKSPEKFGGESQDLKPPAPPLRLESQDDLSTIGLKRSHHRRKYIGSSEELDSRFKSVFGAEIAARLNSSKGMDQTHRIELNSLASLAAPKFPMRKGSRDDLCALKSSSLMSRLGTSSGVNKKLELRHFLDEVTNVLDDSTVSSRRLSDGDHANVPFLSPYGSPDTHDFEIPTNWGM